MTPEQRNLEQDIDKERSKLAESLSDLTDQLSPERLVNSVGETIKTQSSDLANMIARGARDNPIALGLMGAGLAFLLIGGSKAEEPEPRGPADYDRRPIPTSPGLARTEPRGAFTDRVAAAEGDWDRRGDADPSRFQQARDRVRETASQMRDRLYEGTSQLSDVARARVVDARHRAIAAQERIEYHAGRARSAGGDFLQDNPMAVGAGAAVLGALAGYALPRTDYEDRTFGAQRDALMSEADRVLHEELERAKAMGRAALDEAQNIAHEAVEDIPSGDEAIDQAEAKVRGAGERIAERAKEAGRKSGSKEGDKAAQKAKEESHKAKA
jgi:hypothetical protein